jgi:hypothetical protein
MSKPIRDGWKNDAIQAEVSGDIPGHEQEDGQD